MEFSFLAPLKVSLGVFHFVAVGITLHFVSGRYVAWIAIRSVLSDWLRYRCATTSHR